MRFTTPPLLRIAFGTGVIALSAWTSTGILSAEPVALPSSVFPQSASPAAEILHPSVPPDIGRIAHRLQRRLRMRGGSPPLHALARAVEQRRDLLRATGEITFTAEKATQKTWTWHASTQQYPLWIGVRRTYGDLEFFIDPAAIRSTIATERIVDAPAPVDVSLLSVTLDENGVRRAVTDGVAKPGVLIDIDRTVPAMTAVIMRGTGSAAVPLIERAGMIRNETGEDLGDLQLLAVGQSNFKGSAFGRIANVRKALREHVNNTMAAADETYSFNATLGGPIDGSNGWALSKVIFEGDQLRDAPGGGICQASTTVFRAVLNAGLPIEKQKNHSLYVTYYEQHGVGIDATVYPGQQDLTFVNDTGHPVLVQAYDDGFDAYVLVYGTPDGRTVDLQGPFFTANASEAILEQVEKVRSNEIGWLRTVALPDGTVQRDAFVSRYKSVPKSIVKKYAVSQRME